MSAALELVGVAKRFGDTQVLTDATYELRPGITVLLGPSGSGKSTLLRLVLGTLSPDAGEIRVAGGDVLRGARASREAIGYLPDVHDVPGWMTPRGLFSFLEPQYPAWNNELVEHLVAELGVCLDKRFEHASGGEANKAMLVAAMAHEPPLLLLDEPFSGFDPPTREQLISAFLSTLDIEKSAVLIATHDLDVSGRLADQVAVLSDGVLSDMGTLAEILELMGEESHIPERLRDLYDEEIRVAIAEANVR